MQPECTVDRECGISKISNQNFCSMGSTLCVFLKCTLYLRQKDNKFTCTFVRCKIRKGKLITETS